MREIIEVLSVSTGVNLSGHDSSTPCEATVLLDCGHTTRVSVSHSPAYDPQGARASAHQLVGDTIPSPFCERCAAMRADHNRETESPMEWIGAAQRRLPHVQYAAAMYRETGEEYYLEQVAWPGETP